MILPHHGNGTVYRWVFLGNEFQKCSRYSCAKSHISRALIGACTRYVRSTQTWSQRICTGLDKLGVLTVNVYVNSILDWGSTFTLCTCHSVAHEPELRALMHDMRASAHFLTHNCTTLEIKQSRTVLGLINKLSTDFIGDDKSDVIDCDWSLLNSAQLNLLMLYSSY